MARKWWWIAGALVLVYLYFYVNTPSGMVAIGTALQPAAPPVPAVPVAPSSAARIAVASIELGAPIPGAARRHGLYGF